MKKTLITSLFILIIVLFPSFLISGVDPNPLIVSIYYETRYALENVTIYFYANISGGNQPYTISWNMGDGTNYNTPQIWHSYSNPGNFTVTLNVWDTQGRHASDSKLIYILPSSENIFILNSNNVIPECFDIDIYDSGIDNKNKIWVEWRGDTNDYMHLFFSILHRENDNIVSDPFYSEFDLCCIHDENREEHPDEADEIHHLNFAIDESLFKPIGVWNMDRGMGPVSYGIMPYEMFYIWDEGFIDMDGDGIHCDETMDNSIPIDCIYWPDSGVTVLLQDGENLHDGKPNVFINYGPVKCDYNSFISVMPIEYDQLKAPGGNPGVLTLYPRYNNEIVDYTVYWAFTRWDTSLPYLTPILLGTNDNSFPVDTEHKVNCGSLIPVTDSNGLVWTVWQRWENPYPSYVYAKAYEPITQNLGPRIQITGNTEYMGGYNPLAVVADNNKDVYVIWHVSGGRWWCRIIKSYSLNSCSIVPSINEPPIKLTNDGNYSEVHATYDLDNNIWFCVKNLYNDTLCVRFFKKLDSM